MKTKTKIIGTLTASFIIGILIILWSNWEMLNATYKICKIEIQLSHYLPELEEIKARHYELADKVKDLQSQMAELQNKRIDLATVYTSADEAIEK